MRVARLLLLLLVPGAEASEAAAVISVGTVLLLVGSCIACCCLSGVGMYFVCCRRLADYRQDIGGLELVEEGEEKR